MHPILDVSANILTLVCISLALIASIEIYIIVRARSIGILIAAWAYIFVWRSLVTMQQFGTEKVQWLQSHSQWFLPVFYVLVAAGMLTLMYSLRNPLNRKREDHGKDKL